MALVINDMAARLENDADQEEVIREMISLSVLPTLGNDKSALQGYADENLSGELVDELNGLVDKMTTNDVRQTLWRISAVADTMSFAGEDATIRNETKWAINCAEDVAFRQDPELVTELLAKAPYPQLATGSPESYQNDILLCSFFPETVIDPSFSEPVESDIPVLLLQGQMDMQTPPSQALEVASHLPNSIYVPINSEGHVVIGKDAPCPGEIAAQFLNDPMGDLDTSCADAYIVDWVLP